MVQDAVVLDERTSQDLRRAMVDNQIRTFDVTDQKVLEAFYQVPRERFIPPHLAPLAYSDAPITLKSAAGDDHVLLPPLFLARMLQAATVSAGARALVVASATGYTAALLVRLVDHVVALDSNADFSATASRLLPGVGGSRVEIVTGPLAQGHPPRAPYDLILVPGAVECNLETLFGQLAPRGCLIAIDAQSSMASRRACKAVRYDKVDGEISARALFDATVPVLPAFREPARFVF